jgi:hypothetical protein
MSLDASGHRWVVLGQVLGKRSACGPTFAASRRYASADAGALMMAAEARAATQRSRRARRREQGQALSRANPYAFASTPLERARPGSETSASERLVKQKSAADSTRKAERRGASVRLRQRSGMSPELARLGLRTRIVGSMKGSYVLLSVALALSVVMGAAAATRPCGRAVIDDWYDNGTIDGSWDCSCLRDAIALLPDTRGPYLSAKDIFQEEPEQQGCVDSSQQVVTIQRSTLPAGSDRSIVVSDDSFPWGAVVVGGSAVALAALVILAAQRQRRKRSA